MANKWLKYSLIGLGVGVFVGFGLSVGILQAPVVKKSFTPQPERFTELYFEDHLTLPQQASAGAEIDFTYTIHNLEYQSTAYDSEIWLIPEEDTALTQMVSTTQKTLEHDGFVSVPVSLELPKLPTQRIKVEVKLGNLDQTIHFWLNLDGIPATPSAEILEEI